MHLVFLGIEAFRSDYHQREETNEPFQKQRKTVWFRIKNRLNQRPQCDLLCHCLWMMMPDSSKIMAKKVFDQREEEVFLALFHSREGIVR